MASDDEGVEESRGSIRNYMPPQKELEVESSLADALESVSRSSSPVAAPGNLQEQTPRPYFDYFEKLKSERKVCQTLS